MLATLNALLPQLTSDVELFVSDNSSADGTLAVISRFAEYISINCQATNVGAEQNILDCLQLGSGEYIWLLNDDDLISETAVSQVLNAIENYSPIPLIWAKAKDLDPSHNYWSISSMEDWTVIDGNSFLVAIGCWITFCPSIIVRRDCIGEDRFGYAMGSSLLPTAIALKALADANKVAISRSKIIEPQEGEIGRYDVFTIFTNNIRKVCHLYKNKPFSDSALEKVYKDCYNNVLAGRIKSWPLSLKSVFFVTLFGLRYGKFYSYYLPAIAKRGVRKVRTTITAALK